MFVFEAYTRRKRKQCVCGYSRWSQRTKSWSWPWRGYEAWASRGGCERRTLDASCGIHPAAGSTSSGHKTEVWEEEEEEEVKTATEQRQNKKQFGVREREWGD